MSADINKPFYILFDNEAFYPECMAVAELDTLESRVRCKFDEAALSFAEYAMTEAEYFTFLYAYCPARKALREYFTSKGLWLCEWCHDRVYRLERGLCDNCADLHAAEMMVA